MTILCDNCGAQGSTSLDTPIRNIKGEPLWGNGHYLNLKSDYCEECLNDILFMNWTNLTLRGAGQ